MTFFEHSSSYVKVLKYPDLYNRALEIVYKIETSKEFARLFLEEYNSYEGRNIFVTHPQLEKIAHNTALKITKDYCALDPFNLSLVKIKTMNKSKKRKYIVKHSILVNDIRTVIIKTFNQSTIIFKSKEDLKSIALEIGRAVYQLRKYAKIIDKKGE